MIPDIAVLRWLRLEGLATLSLSVAAYGMLAGDWIRFALLLLLPDASMLAYLMSVRAGTMTYNLAHTLTTPALVAGIGLAVGSTGTLAVALIWFAHIGLDRMLGYGLKLSSGFHDTHLGRIGRAGDGVHS